MHMHTYKKKKILFIYLLFIFLFFLFFLLYNLHCPRKSSVSPHDNLHADVTDDVLTHGRPQDGGQHLPRVEEGVALMEVVVTPIAAERGNSTL